MGMKVVKSLLQSCPVEHLSALGSILDTLSRAPVDDPTSANIAIADDVEHFIHRVVVSQVIMAQSINSDTNSTTKLY